MATPGNDENILLIGDPSIDADALWARVRANLASRRRLPPFPASMGTAQLARRREKLLKMVKDLRERVHDYGIVETHRGGWLGRFDLFLKKSLRKLILRHILQQQRVHLKLLNILNQFVGYLEHEDQAVRSSLDHTDRQAAQRVALLPVGKERQRKRPRQGTPV